MHAPSWLPVQALRCYGVAVANLEDGGTHPLVLSVHLGEALLIRGECGEWFYARTVDGHKEGIIPKSFLRIKDSSFIINGETEVVVPKEPTLAQEIGASLQEWYKIGKQLYVRRYVDGTERFKMFGEIREKIMELHDCRKRLLSSNLTVEGLKELKKAVATIIDSGNSLLKLDMVVRDDQGNPLDPLSTSTVQLFRQHQRSSQKLRKSNRGSHRPGSRIIAHSSHSLIVIVDAIKWRIVDACEMRFFLCEARPPDELFPFSESVQITERAGHPSKTPFKFLFTDLGKSDFERGRIYLVAYVSRVGPMELKESEGKRDNTPFSDKRSNIQVKRPYGVAVKEVTNLFRDVSSKPKMMDITNELQTVSYLPCSGEDTLDDTLKKLVSAMKGEGPTSNGKEIVGFFVRLSMVPGDPKQIQEEQPVLLRGNPIVARKMGFPEVILPNDTRNDLYIKLIRGEFHRTAKTTDRNVEVTVSVHNDRGGILPGIVSGGNGAPPTDQYRSTVYYHNDKPRWNDYLKISLPMQIEDFSIAHIKFTFKHRSSSESKDKSEKPFALAYLRLKEREGTAIRDDNYELILYKIDPKHYKEGDVQYLSLPYIKTPNWDKNSKPTCAGLTGFSCSSKDYFYVKTTLCSTNFTQNADLLELLLWVTKLRQLMMTAVDEQRDISQEGVVKILLDNLKQILEKVTKVSGEEIVKFLHPILDALFLILVDPIEQISSDFLTTSSLMYENEASCAVNCDRYVFNCLLHIFGLILDHKYQNFQSVLNLYIEDNFSSTLAYKKLAKELGNSIESDSPEVVLKVMKSIEFFFRFIIRSFEIHKRLRLLEFGPTGQDRDDDECFQKTIDTLFNAMCTLLKRKEGRKDPYIGAEGGCLKHIPTVIPDLIRVFPSRRLTEHLVELCCVVPSNKLSNIKLSFISEIVHSPLFEDTECRFNLLPTVANNILAHLPGTDEELRRKSLETMQMVSSAKLRKIFGPEDIASAAQDMRSANKAVSAHSEETEKCVELLGDVMDILHTQSEEVKVQDVGYIMQILLRPIIFSIGTIGMDDPLASNMVSIFLALLREMKNYHYQILIHNLKPEAADPYKQGLLKFLNDVLVVMKNLFHAPYFPSDWSAMILLQNSIVFNAMEHFASTIKGEFAEPFEEQPWNNFFICAVSFLTQPSLQIEDFSKSKRNYVLHNYEDMRKRAAKLIRLMWFCLGESKRNRFVPTMVGTFLDMALVPEPELRKTTIPIFFDMMHCEFDQDRPLKSFKIVEDELMKKIVEGLEGGKGDPAFKDIFSNTMSELCEHNSTGLRHQGLEMVRTLTNLMELLLQYREIENEENPGNRMSCIVNLLDFSKEIDRKELYLRYLYKLHDLHVASKNFTEAAFTLKLHSHQLEWSEEEVPLLLRVVNRHPNLLTQMELKEALYSDIIRYFDTAKMWECALEVCEEIRQQHEETYNYSKLPKLHRQIADFYDRILDEPRFKPEYFRVAFYGGGFPSFLQDKVFVYRGRPLDQLSDFEGRMLGQYVQAELLRNLGPPSDDIRFSNKQYLQICKVNPVMTTMKRLSGMKYADDNILNYYKYNEIEKFTYSRPYHMEPKDPDNEFASLWLDRYTLWISQSFPGIMSWFPVVRDTLVKVRPIENAIETLENANENMRRLVIAHCSNTNQDLGEMTMKLNGIVDAAVMGGVANYEKAFITENYLMRNPADYILVESLKDLIFQQIPIIEECLKIHGKKSQASLLPLHKRLEEVFKSYIIHIEETYGIICNELRDEKLDREMRRAQKKQEAKIKRLEPARPMPPEPEINVGHRGSVVTMGRSVGSFASSTSLYHQNGSNRGRSMVTISNRSQVMIRRSTHSSFSGSIEGDQFTHGATLPRPNGPFIPSKNNTGEEPLILLNQTLVTQRPPRHHHQQEQRNSWNNGSRLSEMSMSSMELHPIPNSDPSSRNSLNSPDSAIGEEPPALPPKLRTERSEVPPPPPPKKPPLKQFRDL